MAEEGEEKDREKRSKIEGLGFSTAFQVVLIVLLPYLV